MIGIQVQVAAGDFRLDVRCELPVGVSAVVGPSGAGKTTLLEAIAGIRRGVTGRIEVGDLMFLDSAVHLDLPAEKRRIGFLPQDVALFPHLSVRENILFARKSGSLDALTQTLAIDHLLDRRPATLSGGEKQRVGLARALMTRPRLLLLDEPFAAVDQPLRDRLVLYLRRIRDTFRIPMIYVTHQIVEALALADYAVALRDGRVVASGAADEILHHRSVAGAQSVENVATVDHAVHDPGRGVTVARTQQGMTVVLPYDDVKDAIFPIVINISGDDVVIFRQEPQAISARNIFRGRVASLERDRGNVEMTIETPSRFRVRTTVAAADDLQLATGVEVWLALRAHAIRVIG